MGLKEIFPQVKKPIIGMIHLSPLPGSYTHQGEPLSLIQERALEDARRLAEAGFDGFLMQNANDRPASLEVCPEKVAYMSVIGAEIRREFPGIPLGVNVTWNVPKAAIAIAHATGGSFVRLEHVYMGVAVTAYGLVQGCSHEATQFLKLLDAREIQIFADVYEAHSVPLGRLPIEEAALYALVGCQANVLIITGRTLPESIEMIGAIKRVSPKAEVLLGGGSSKTEVKEVLELADGVVVGRALKEEGRVWNPVNTLKAKEYMEAVQRARS